MFRLFTSVAILLSMLYSVAAQNEVLNVSPPTGTPVNFGAHAMIEWVNGNPQPCPAGTWSIQNAAVNPDQTLQAWSQPKVMQLPAGWMLLGRAGNLPTKRAAVVWLATHQETGRQIWLRQGTQDGNYSWWTFGSPGKDGYPWSGNSNYPYILVPTKLGNAAPISRTSPTAITLKQSSAQVDAVAVPPAVPPAPECWLVSCPLSEVKVARSWVTHNGETGLSPVGTFPAMSGWEMKQGLRRASFTVQSGASLATEKIPEGVLGYYVYLQIGGKWKRQLSLPWLSDTPGNDKYLRSPHDNQPVIWSAYDGPVHSPSSRPCSVVTPLQRAAYRGDSFITPAAVESLYGPMIIGCEPSKPGQAIGGLAGWRLKQVHNVPATAGITFPNDHPTFWPAIITQNDEKQGTSLNKVAITYEYPEHQSGRGPGLSIGVTGSDFSGGQAFKFNCNGCFFKIDEYDWKWRRFDLHIGVESAGFYGHTPSEWRYSSSNFQRVNVEGPQSINHYFEKCHISFVRTSQTLLKFKEIIMPGGADTTIFDVGDNAGVNVDGLFTDVSCYSLFDCNGSQTRELNISNPTSVCGFEYFVRSPMNQQPHKVVLQNWSYWRPSNDLQGYLYSGWRNVFDVRTDGSDVLKGRLTPAQPPFPYGNP